MNRRRQGGYWWPQKDKSGAAGILSHTKRHFPAAMEFVKNRRVAIQAGGNVGVYPFNLSIYFDTVHTFEPDPENFARLLENIAGQNNIHAVQCALGEMDGTAGLEQNIPGNCGTFRPVPGMAVRVTGIDYLELEPDLIWLDVEGYETKVLQGAIKTIEKHRPVLIFEDMGLGDSPRKWAELHGYKFAKRIKNDDIMIPC